MFDPRVEGTNELYFATKQRQEIYVNLNESGIQFRTSNETTKDDESGVCSPPLWTKSPPSIPMASDQSYVGFRVLSPTSRAQAIAKGQRELMEMVQAMPESSYELSLKDLVEYHSVKGLEKTCLVEKREGDKKSLSKKGSANAKRQESVRKFEKRGTTILGRSESNVNGNNNNNNDKGVFLKMVFPISLGRRRRKKTKENPYAKVSTKKTDANADNSKGLIKVAEKEWWRRRSSVSDESRGCGISSGSGSSGSSGSSGCSGSSRSNRGNSHRKKNGCLQGFTSLYSTKNNKSTK